MVIIYAKQIDEQFRNDLFDVIRKNCGDGSDTAVLPCVVDLEKMTCTFDSLRIPYIGFQYPVKNRGIRLIRKYLFSGKFTYAYSPDMLVPTEDIDPEQSLWSFWRATKRELILDDKEAKKRFEKNEAS